MGDPALLLPPSSSSIPGISIFVPLPPPLPLIRTAAKKLRTASGLSATGNGHHSSHAGVRGATLSVGTSRERASSAVRWRMRVKPAMAAAAAVVAGELEGEGEEEGEREEGERGGSGACPPVAAAAPALTRCHEAKSSRVW